MTFQVSLRNVSLIENSFKTENYLRFFLLIFIHVQLHNSVINILTRTAENTLLSIIIGMYKGEQPISKTTISKSSIMWRN